MFDRLIIAALFIFFNDIFMLLALPQMDHTGGRQCRMSAAVSKDRTRHCRRFDPLIDQLI